MLTEQADDEEPRHLALLFAGFVLLCWAMLAIGNAPTPILHDMVEAFAWGQEFQLGYNQHPPFWAWVCGAWFAVLPRAGWSFALLDAVNAGVGLAGAWALIGDFARGRKRIAAFGLLLLTPIYTLGAYKYDANTIFLSIWPWMTHAFVQAMRTRSLPAAIAFGALAGLALLSKYYAALLLLVCLFAALSAPEGRAYLRSASPWISALVAAILFAPHALWLVVSGAPPLRYYASVSHLPLGVIWRDILSTAVTSVLSFALVAGVVAFSAWRGRCAAPAREPETSRPLLILGLGPLALTLLSGIALGIRLTPEMPIGALALVPLVLIEWARVGETAALARFSSRAAVIAVLAMAALSPVVMLVRTYVGKNAAHVAPFQEVASEVDRRWRELTPAPLAYVGGVEYAHYAPFYGPDRAHAFFKFDYAANLWVTPERIARDGLAAVCAAEDAACLAAAARFSTPATQRITISVAHRFLSHVADPREVVLLLTPPAP